MPRVNPLRTLANERNLARRIAFERERRGWSYEGTAARMTAAGFPIQASAIFKIEKGQPPRRITVDEAVGFAAVFDIPLAELVIDPDVAAVQGVTELLDEWRQVTAERVAVVTTLDERSESLKQQVRALVAGRPAALKAVESYFQALAPDSHWADDLAQVVMGESDAKH
jgi:transcriptional regulator with XRE-family HTH domain